MVFVSVDDLIFLSKILEAARLLGVPVKSVPPSGLVQEIRQNPGCQLILDLNHPSGTAIDLVRTLKNDPSTRGVPILGFVSHLQTKLIGCAREAGCDKVVARSAFSEQLPRFLTELAEARSARPHE
jgi:CheY-like chemotaxis protein